MKGVAESNPMLGTSHPLEGKAGADARFVPIARGSVEGRGFWDHEPSAAEALGRGAVEITLDRDYETGQRVAENIELHPLPADLPAHPLATLKPKFFLANGNAMLVLPASRIVIDVYRGARK